MLAKVPFTVQQWVDFHAAAVEAARTPVLVMLYRGLVDRAVAAMRAPGLQDISGFGRTDLVAAIRDRSPQPPIGVARAART